MKDIEYNIPIDDYTEGYVQINYSKDKFIENYLSYLQNGDENIPIDIINSKISIIDFLYVPFYNCEISAYCDVDAEIGYDYTQKELTGNYNDVYIGNRIIREPEIVEKTKTRWEDKSISVDISDIYTFFIKDSFWDFNKNLSGKNYSFFPTKEASFKKLKETYSLDEITGFCAQKIDEQLVKKSIYRLSQIGDGYRNVSYYPTYIENANFTKLFLPVGYIKYNYRNREYFFIQSLYDLEILQSSIPKDVKFKKANSFNFSKKFLILLFYIFMSVLYYIMTSLINLQQYSLLLFFTIFIILFVDCLVLYTNLDEKRRNNILIRHEYIKSLFSANEEKLKNYIQNLHMEYKE